MAYSNLQSKAVTLCLDNAPVKTTDQRVLTTVFRLSIHAMYMNELFLHPDYILTMDQ